LTAREGNGYLTITLTGINHRAVAEIDLGALRSNYHALRALDSRAELMVVVKADAYGHGAVSIARELANEGCGHFGVATVEEGRELRAAGQRGRIYLLGGFFHDDVAAIIGLDLTPFVFDVDKIRALDAAAADVNRPDFPIHLKIDTGAPRLGVLPGDLPAAIEELRAARHLKLEGLSTLLASAGDPASPVTDLQLAVFNSAMAALGDAGLTPRYAHVANSAAIVMRTDSHYSMMRAGLSIYGLPPVPAVGARVALRPVMTFKTRILQIKSVPAGSGVSYGHTFITQRPSMIGVLPVGYADGYRRGLQHGGEVIVRARRAPVVGAVCMDLTMVDLTEISAARTGDEVILWGGADDDSISVNDVARLANTISYEMLSTVGKRVPRVYRG
jgi:alanine racemase